MASPDAEVELFRRGKKVLGSRAGGQIAKLKTAKGGSIALARAAIEQASTKEDPAEYIAKIILGGAGPPAFNGGCKQNGGFTQYLIDQENRDAAITIDHDYSELADHRH